jgi:hypothetical protein
MTQSRPIGSVSRRTALAGLGAGGLGLALATRVRSTAAQDAAATGHPYIGIWLVDRDPDSSADSPTINIMTADGAVIDPLLAVGGVWEPSGPRSAMFTLLTLIDGGLGGYVVIRGFDDVDEAGMNTSGKYSVTIVGTDGVVLRSVEGRSRATRMPVQPMEDGGNPMAEIPAWTPAPQAGATPAA